MKPVHDLNLPALPPQLLEAVGSINNSPDRWSPLQAAAGKESNWQAFRYNRSGKIALTIGSPISILNNVNDHHEISAFVDRMLNDTGDDFGLDGYEPNITKIHNVRNLISVLVEPTIEDVKVYGSYVVFNFNQHGYLVSIKAHGFGNSKSGSFSLSEADILSIARKSTTVHNGEAKVKPVWLPCVSNGKVELRASYQVSLIAADPQFRPVLFIDAETGETLAAENRVVYDRVDGRIRGQFKPLYRNDDNETAPFTDEWIHVENRDDYTDEDGEFSFNVHPNAVPYNVNSELRGRWVNVDYEDGPDGQYRFNLNAPGRIELLWDEDRARDDERGLYYHTNFIHNFWKRLDPDFDALDYPMPAVCGHGNRYDNAFWNGEGMFFGEGNEMDNLALYADIIYHEYTHGVTGNIYPWGVLPYTGESGALNEAWSDYFPCSITDEPLIGEGGLRGHGYIRNLDNDLVYPEHIRNEVHLDSRMPSGAMWHTREVLGREITDPLFHFSKYLFGNDFITYFADVLLTDDDDGDISNGTPHSSVIYAQFGRHGIGPGVDPDLLVTSIDLFDDDIEGADGDDNALWERGETIRVEIELFRDGGFFPPPAEDVRIELSSDHPAIDLFQPEANYGDMYVGDRRVGDFPFLFRIANDVSVSFADFTFTISADAGDYQRQESFRIPLGHPPVLIVRDDNGHRRDRTPHFEATLNALSVIFSKFSTTEPFRPLNQRLELFDTVIWFTGDARENILAEESVEELEIFLDRGGNLLLTGQSAGSVRDAELFLANYLGVVSVIDSTRDFEIRGVEDDPIGQGLWMILLGQPGAMNQRRPGVVQAIEPAIESFHWQRIEGNPAAGVRRIDPQTGARTIFLSFGLEGVSGAGPTDSREQALSGMLEWLGLPMEAPSAPDVLVSFAVYPAYPNPFNSTSTICFDLLFSMAVRAEVFDLAGRFITKLTDDKWSAGLNVIEWDANGLPSGIYVVTLSSVNKSKSQKIVLLR